MITSINDNNRAKYEALFKKASLALGEQEDAIQTLEQYFNNIQDLAKIDKKFTVLPTDEDYFEIDANSRAITIPATFKKNGLGVKGDQVAEIVYFRVDRYYDFMDLALDNVDIVIQWKNADGKTGTSGVWLKDVDTYTDKLVFGWPIDRDITDTAGVLQFSVRFISFDNKENRNVIYSLSTLTASVGINPSITEIEPDELIFSDEINDMVFNRIQNTTTSTNEDIETTPPRFLEDRFNPVFGEQDLLILDDVALVEGKEQKLKARAYKTTIHGTLKYDIVSSANSTNVLPLSINKEIVYEDADGKSYNAETEYYDSNHEIITVDSADIAEGKIAKAEKYFEPICVASVKKAGTYYFAADTWYNSFHHYIVYPKGYKIPGAGNVTITLSQNGNYIREDGLNSSNISISKEDKKSTLAYSWHKQNEKKSDSLDYIPDVEGEYILKVISTRNNDSKVFESEPVHVYDRAVEPQLVFSPNKLEFTVGDQISCNIINNSSMKNVSYEWYYLDNEEKKIISKEAECIIPKDAAGKKITCEVSNYNGFAENGVSATIDTTYIGQ